MKHKFGRRICSALLAATMVISGAATAFAGGDTLAPRPGEQGHLGENQPIYHGHNAYDVRNWSPETDEYADFMRARVPLQKRNDAFRATQANPLLDPEVASLSLIGDYGNEFFDPYTYNDDFAQSLFNFWQYQDIRGSWHGVVTNPTPNSLYDPTAPWNQRFYEFGIINIPNPAYTNAAHKNGVMALGCIFFPRTEHTDDFVYQDENGRFPMVDKLVEMAEYYGFDGYFVNLEEDLPHDFMPLYEEWARAMTSQGMYVNTYASCRYAPDNEDIWGKIGYFDKTAGSFSNLLKGPDDETISSNSLYMNPDPQIHEVKDTVESMKALGLDPRKVVFNTFEAAAAGFSGQRGSLFHTYDENLVPQTGIGNLSGDSYWAHLDEQLFGHSGANNYDENRRGDPDFQKYVFARERAWWSGSMDAPTYKNGGNGQPVGTLESEGMTPEELQNAVLYATFDPVAVANRPGRDVPNEGTDNEGKPYQAWKGICTYVAERSVIGGTNFYTSFNTGHGMQYYKDGQVSNDSQWCNINIQDIPLTWQWWIDTESENRLDLEFDYGPTYSSAFDYEQLGGYEGSSSLAIFGKVDAQSDIRLFKTDLDVNENSKFNLTYNKPTENDVALSVVLYLKDGEAVKTEYIAVPDSAAKTNGWQKVSLDLSGLAGETVAAIGVSVNGNADAYQINLGELSFTDGSVKTPSVPQNFRVDRAFETGEVYLHWDIADYDEVQKYNVYAVDAEGNRSFVGGTYDEVYYVKDTMYDHDGEVTFELTAVGKDGKESAPAAATWNFAAGAAALTAAATETGLELSWTNPETAFASVKAEVSFPYNPYGHTETFTATAGKDVEALSIPVPFSDGSDYIVRVSFLDAAGKVVALTDCSGRLIDNTATPFTGRIIPRTTGYINRRLNFKDFWRVETDIYDWWKMEAFDEAGNPLQFHHNGKWSQSEALVARRGVTSLNLYLYDDVGTLYLRTTDFDGNVAEPVRVHYGDWVDACARFDDVLADKWYTYAIDYMSNHGYMVGIEEKEFDLYSSMNRAQMITLLYRLAGAPAVEELGHPFADVADDVYYHDAVVWGYNNGIINGTSKTTFAPDRDVTRQQFATFLYRFSGAGAVEEDFLEAYPDEHKVADYAREAMNWAVANGLIEGSQIVRDMTALNPADNATRAQVSVIVYRYQLSQMGAE